jgi:hypothetical protein
MTIWYTLWSIALFYHNLVYHVVICSIFTILVYSIKTNLAILLKMSNSYDLPDSPAQFYHFHFDI